MSMKYLSAIVLLSVLTFGSVSAFAASRVSGDFSLDGNVYKITAVLAKTDENSFDESKKDVVVLLTDQPVPEEKFNLSALYDLSQSGLHGIMVSINDQKEVYSMVVLGLAQKSGNKICEFQPAEFSTSAIAGKLFLSQPEESFGHKYSFNIEFQAPVKDEVVAMVTETTGTPLPAGGGEPGKAYMEYDKIIRTGNLDELKKLAANEEMAKQLDDPKAKDLIEMLKVMRATEIKIVKGFTSGDRATLIVEGKDPLSGGKTEGTIRMIQVDKKWKVEKESWKAGM